MAMGPLEKLMKTVETDSHRLTQLDVCKDIDPDSDISVLIEQRQEIAGKEGDAWLRDAWCLICMWNTFALAGDYKPTMQDFGRFLQDNDIGLGTASAQERMVVYSKICNFDAEVIDMFKMMGLKKAFVCAKVRDLNEGNVLRICNTALRSNNASDLAIKLKEEFAANYSPVNSPAAIQAREVGKEVIKEARRKTMQQAATIICLQENVNGDLVGGQIFIPRQAPLNEYNGIRNVKYHERCMQLVFNAAKESKTPDEFFADLMMLVIPTLNPDKLAEIDAILLQEFPKVHQKFSKTEEAAT